MAFLMIPKPMRILYLLMPLFVIGLASNSCSSSFGNSGGEFKADTVVAIENIKNITVQTGLSDSSYQVVSYWTDQDGRPLFQKSEEMFINGSLDGFQRKWDSNGTLIFEAQWSGGMPVEYLQEFHANGQLKKRIYYNAEKGYPDFEVNFHANGAARTDTIIYSEGKREGMIHYYTDEGKLKETHVYANDSLIRIMIYRKDYEDLALMIASIKSALEQDSLSRLERDSLFAELMGKLETNGNTALQWKDDYNKLEELKYLEGLLGRLEDSTSIKKEEKIKD